MLCRLALGTQIVEQRINSEVYLNPWITHWALALVKGNREPHEAKKKFFDHHMYDLFYHHMYDQTLFGNLTG